MIAAGSRRGRRRLRGAPLVLALLLLALVAAVPQAAAQSNDECLMCHSDNELTGTRNGKEISVYVDGEAFAASVHGGFDCVDCHQDLAGVELPHDEDVKPVNCGICHEDAGPEVARSVHEKALSESGRPAAACVSCHGNHDILAIPSGAAAKEIAVKDLCGKCHQREARGHSAGVHAKVAREGDELAPNCVTCHENHAILGPEDESSPIATVNVPLLCGRCHHEGSKVSLEHNIPQQNILENYSESIHGEGLFKKGLTVTAVCTSCHTPHQILPHTDPRSSINPKNVAHTCTKCHARIEQVHVKVIEGRLWEEEPHKIPSCIECHSPHKIRISQTPPGTVSTGACFKCHADPTLTGTIDGQKVSMYVDPDRYAQSMHKHTACAQCHTDITPGHSGRPCATIATPITVDCSVCHAQQVNDHSASIHGQLAAKGDPDAPTCLDCHDQHYPQDHLLPSSPTFKRNVPQLCARCHRQGEPAARRIKKGVPNIVESYTESIHGKGLVEAGLVVSAACTDCHTTHRMLPPDDPDSSVNPTHIADTCGRCHNGIEETFKTSIHWPGNADTDRKLPTCEDCHTSHTISRTDVEGFRFKMMNQCGNCHQSEAETFFDTYHGKVSRLGSEGAAKCYDCHGTHNILPPDNPESTLSHKNVVKTCGKCHSGAHRRFAGYLTHATHHDPKKYPYLFYAFWFMTALLVGTLTFALLHTFAWLWRLWRTREQWLPHKGDTSGPLYERFTWQQRTMHLVMLLCFFTLALTGMTLKFSYMGWAVVLSRILGGFLVMGILHRIAAVTLIGLFVFHLVRVWRAKQDSGQSWKDFIFGPNSLMFNFTDLKQVAQSIKWFLGRGERPNYGRFTYWEKFDYFAVFWGVFVIGSTGLVLWFPEFFTRILPGWSVNVATIIHSDEALLAVGFIFTIHFFNTHFRPDKFPMDPVIFTGRVSLEELKHDKPAEYQALVDSGRIAELEAGSVRPAPRRFERVARIFGFTALGIGLTLIFLIMYAMLFGYR